MGIELPTPMPLLPSQFDTVAGSKLDGFIGERRLMVAMLLDAALTIQRNRRDRLTALTVLWVGSDDRAPFSFMWLCEELGLNAERLRQQMRHPEDLKRGRRHPRRALTVSTTARLYRHGGRAA